MKFGILDLILDIVGEIVAKLYKPIHEQKFPQPDSQLSGYSQYNLTKPTVLCHFQE